MDPINGGTETHCNFTCILCVGNPAVTSAVKNVATIRNVKVMWDILNGNAMSV